MPRKNTTKNTTNAMPRKNTTFVANIPRSAAEEEDTHVCPICAEPIVDEDEDGCAQDALFCEGVCQRWLHRWCAGVTSERYVVLSSIEDPFHCPSCTVAGQQAAITAQQADIACLRECVNALTDEVRALKATVAAMQTQPLSNSTSLPTGLTKRWATVVSKGSGYGSKGKGKGVKSNPNPHSPSFHQSSQGQRTDSRGGSKTKTDWTHGPQGQTKKPNIPQSERVRVSGARRLWGTFKTTSINAVRSALTKLTTVGNKVSIRRKYKKHDSGRVCWWFVLKGEEPDLATMEREWQQVSLQLSWKIEPCYKPLSCSDGTTAANEIATTSTSISTGTPPPPTGETSATGAADLSVSSMDAPSDIPPPAPSPINGPLSGNEGSNDN